MTQPGSPVLQVCRQERQIHSPTLIQNSLDGYARLFFSSRGVRIESTMAFAAHQRVRVNLAGLMIQGVTFHAAVTDALATIVRKTTEDPPAYLVDLLFSFKGLKEIEVPEERIRPA